MKNGFGDEIFEAAADTFLKEHIEENQYASIMKTRRGRDYPYVVARLFLSESDWKRYVWIAHHGSLDGYGE